MGALGEVECSPSSSVLSGAGAQTVKAAAFIELDAFGRLGVVFLRTLDMLLSSRTAPREVTPGEKSPHPATKQLFCSEPGQLCELNMLIVLLETWSTAA